jgi:arylsulfatase
MSLIKDKKSPNILVLLTDQQRFDTIAAAGFSHMKTPNLDRLVQEGCLFDNAYTPNPICVPARYHLITGTNEKNHGITSNQTDNMTVDGLPTLPGVLSDNGYFTAAVGKMHFTPVKRHHGFLEMHLMEEIPAHRTDDSYSEWLEAEGLDEIRAVHGCRPLIYHEPQRALVDNKHHGSNWVAERTINVINRNGGRRPFFIECGWIHPHPPWNIPENWWGYYDNMSFPDPIPGPRIAPMPTQNSNWFGDNDGPDVIRREREAYYTSISMVDAAVGKILDHLGKIGILDNTLVIFTSDHGEMLRDHGLFQKMVPYESATHIPFIIRWPEYFKPGSREKSFVDLMDIMPTVLDAAAISPGDIRSSRPFDPAGSSLLRIHEKKGRDRSIQFCSHNSCENNRWVLVRDQQYKYVHFTKGGVEWFFDLKNDPCEKNNLIGTDLIPVKEYERLKQLCIKREERWGPKGAAVNGELAQKKNDYPKDELPVLCGKFPGWANMQMPVLGDASVDEEAFLLAEQIKKSLHWADQEYIGNVISETMWFEHFLDCYRERGVSEEKINEIVKYLDIPQM